MTHVIQDRLGLYHIITSEKPFSAVWFDWILKNDLERFAVSKDDLQKTLAQMGVAEFMYHTDRGYIKKRNKYYHEPRKRNVPRNCRHRKQPCPICTFRPYE